MTTTPVDAAAGTLDRPPIVMPGDAPASGSAPVPWWRPDRRWAASGRRFLPGVSFPVTVFVVWRLLSLWASLRQRGSLVETAFNYDGEHYLRILHYGYWNPRPVMPAHAFFPGVSWFATPIYRLTGSDAITVHVVATVGALAAFVAVWGVTRAWRDERVARRAVVLFALFPSSLFLWAFYSEALFIALGAGAVWADRAGRRGVAAACLAAVATTRSIGVLIPVVLVVARVIRRRGVDRWALGYGAAGVAGFGAVLAVMWRQVGDPFAWISVQDDWGRALAPPWVAVRQGIDNLHPSPRTVMVPALVARNLDLWCVAIVVVAILYLAFSRRERFPMEAWMLGVAMVALPLSSSVLASFNRFVFANWVIYPAYASVAGRLPRWARWPVQAVVVVAAGLVSYAMIGRFSVNRFVG